VLANALPRAEFGVYVPALSVGVTSGSLVDLGTERSVVKFLPEVAGRQGRRGGRWCLDPDEDSSPGQMEEIDSECRSYPELGDVEFVAERLDQGLK